MKILQPWKRVRSEFDDRPTRTRFLFGSLRLRISEALSLAAVLVFIAVIVVLYWTRVRPLEERVESLRRQEVELRARIEKRSVDEKRREEQATNSGRIIQSLHQFEEMLQREEPGIASIIDEMDAVGRNNKVIVGDASYRFSPASQIVDSNGAPLPDVVSGEKDGNVYPGMAVDTTIIGDYPNLRRFIASLEQSRHFLIINALAFQGEADKVRRETAKIGNNAPIDLAAPDSVPVSLKLEMDAYFQRPQNRP